MPETTEFYQKLLDNLYDGIYFVDRERRITYWNGAAERITGYSREHVLGRSCADNLLMHINDEGTMLCTTGCPLLGTINDGGLREAEVYLHHADGHRVPVLVRAAPIHDAAGEIVGAVEVFSDNSAMLSARRRMAQLQETTMLDALTGIGNRRYVEMKGASCLTEFHHHGVPFGVLFLDIDHFKRVNDTYGHDVGDLVLKMVAKTLKNGLRATDFVGRWGGEEFVALALHVNATQLSLVGEKLRGLIAASRLATEQGDVQPTISIGVTLARTGDTLEQLFKRADTLLYQSKTAGRNRVTSDE